MTQLLGRFQRQQQQIEDQRKVARIVEDAADVPAHTGATAAGDGRKLRGIPAIGRGVTGAINNTVPHAVR